MPFIKFFVQADGTVGAQHSNGVAQVFANPDGTIVEGAVGAIASPDDSFTRATPQDVVAFHRNRNAATPPRQVDVTKVVEGYTPPA